MPRATVGDRRRPRRRAVQLIVALSAAAALAVGCSTRPAARTYCVPESGEPFAGECPTLCESQCARQRSFDCWDGELDACIDQCKAAASHDDACLDAEYDWWRCLRRVRQPGARCGKDAHTWIEHLCSSDEDTACWTVGDGTCIAENGERLRRCGMHDAGEAEAAARDGSD